MCIISEASLTLTVVSVSTASPELMSNASL